MRPCATWRAGVAGCTLDRQLFAVARDNMRASGSGAVAPRELSGRWSRVGAARGAAGMILDRCAEVVRVLARRTACALLARNCSTTRSAHARGGRVDVACRTWKAPPRRRAVVTTRARDPGGGARARLRSLHACPHGRWRERARLALVRSVASRHEGGGVESGPGNRTACVVTCGGSGVLSLGLGSTGRLLPQPEEETPWTVKALIASHWRAVLGARSSRCGTALFLYSSEHSPKPRPQRRNPRRACAVGRAAGERIARFPPARRALWACRRQREREWRTSAPSACRWCPVIVRRCRAKDRLHRQRGRHDPHECARGRWRAQGDGQADRSPRVRGEGRRRGYQERRRRAEDRGHRPAGRDARRSAPARGREWVVAIGSPFGFENSVTAASSVQGSQPAR